MSPVFSRLLPFLLKKIYFRSLCKFIRGTKHVKYSNNYIKISRLPSNYYIQTSRRRAAIISPLLEPPCPCWWQLGCLHAHAPRDKRLGAAIVAIEPLSRFEAIDINLTLAQGTLNLYPKEMAGIYTRAPSTTSRWRNLRRTGARQTKRRSVSPSIWVSRLQ